MDLPSIATCPSSAEPPPPKRSTLIGAIQLTAALVILGVGLDDALFFGACSRRAILRPACTTSLASLAGLVGLLASDHPLLQRFALALAGGIIAATLLAVFSYRADGRRLVRQET